MPSAMLRIQFFTGWLIVGLVVSACSVEMNQSPISVTQATDEASASAKKPVTWANLNLTGKLVYIAGDITTAKVTIQSLDLNTGELMTIFEVPQRGWTDAAAVAPDHKTLLLAYSPPREALNGAQQSLYTMPIDGSGPPELLIIPETDGDQYSQPGWSPDGKYVYLAHINIKSMTTYEIMRMIYPDGNLEKVVDHAYWPRLSDDGANLVYVSLDPQSGTNLLFFANADGTDAQQIPINGLPVPSVIDAPMFSPDKQTIIFSSPVGIKASPPNWVDELLGVRVRSRRWLPALRLVVRFHIGRHGRATHQYSIVGTLWSIFTRQGTHRQLLHRRYLCDET